MVQAGGSATVYGVLYQMLRAAHWAKEIRLKSTIDGGSLASAQLIIEPQGGGGDVQVVAPGKRIVEQLKAKSDQRTWSVQSIVSEVLPDLVRAASAETDAQPTIYRFVSEGRKGRWKAFDELLGCLCGKSIPAAPIESLDDSELHTFIWGEQHTRRQFFLHLVTELRTHPDLKGDSIDVTSRKLWQVLSAFEFVERFTIQDAESALREFLLQVVDRNDQVTPKVHELAGFLTALAAQGDVMISAEEIWRQAELSATPLGDWPALTERCRGIVSRNVARLFRYREDLDVRVVPDWPKDRPILAITGQSGQGKTWQLSALACQLVLQDKLVVVISSQGNATDSLRLASRGVWKDIANHDSELALDRIAERLRQTCPHLGDPWLYVLVDNVTSVSEARGLAQFDWQHHGIRLAFSTTSQIAASLNSDFGEDLHTFEVDDFTVSELQEYLERQGQEWGLIAPDVRHTLRRPLLAKLFCSVTAENGPSPECEYDLYQRYWDRLRLAGDQPDHPQDLGRITTLASTMLMTETPYPWTSNVLQSVGIDDAAQSRLEKIGWLQRLDDNRVQVWHDRLLNWAVAESVVAVFRSGALTEEHLAERFSALLHPSRAAHLRRLPYVPLDILWLLADPRALCESVIHRLLSTYNSIPISIWQESVWTQDLPTIGERIINPMVSFLRTMSGLEWNFHPRWCAQSIKSIGKRKPEVARSWARVMIHDRSETVQEAGCYLLASFPTEGCLDRLWEIHSQHIRENLDTAPQWQKYERTLAALKSCAHLEPEWLQRRILTIVASDRMASELAYLVASLRNAAGAAIWRDTKHHLLKVVPHEKHRSLATCISVYRDEEEITLLESWVTREEDLIGASSLAALSRMNPATALRSVKQLSSSQRYLARNWWLPELVLRRPIETDQLISELFNGSSDNFWGVANLFQGQEYMIKGKTLRRILDHLRDELGIQLAVSPPQNPRSMYVPLAILTCVRRPELISELERRAGTPLEVHLTRIAISWIGRHGDFPGDEYRAARRLLWMIGGNGFQQIVKAELASENIHFQIQGIKSSVLVADPEIGQLLADIMRRNDSRDEQKFPVEQLEAAVSLAALGEYSLLVESILRWGTALNDAIDLVINNRPMTDEEVAPATRSLKWESTDTSIPAVRVLGISGRRDLSHLIHDMLSEDSSKVESCNAASSALSVLGDRSDATLRLLRRMMQTPSCISAAVTCLARFGLEGTPILSAWLDVNGLTPGDGTSEQIALILSQFPETKRTASSHVLAALRTHGGIAISSCLFDCLEYPDIEAAREQLMELAYAVDMPVHIVGRRVAVIRALSRYDRDVAFRAAEIAMQRTKRDRDLLPSLLMDVDEIRAIPLLLKAVVHERSTAVVWAIGRAARGATDIGLVDSTLKRMFMSTEPIEQRGACLIAGWLESGRFDDELMACAIDSIDTTVNRAAREAIQRRTDERGVLQLFDALKMASGIRAWSYLDAAIGLGDPVLMEDRNDATWLGRALEGHSPYMHILARDRIREREKEIKRNAETRDSAQE